MNTPKATQQQELLDAVNRLSSLLEVFGDSTNEKLRTIDARIAGIDAAVEKVNKSLYGNGVPGIDEVIRDLARRVGEVEQKEAGCGIAQVTAEVDGIKKIHEEEKEAREKEAAERSKARADTRKFFYGVITLILTLAGDIALRLLGK